MSSDKQNKNMMLKSET